MIRERVFHPFWNEVQALQNNPMWRSLQHLQHELNRAFDQWTGPGRNGVAGFPAVNMWEDGDFLMLESELPGVDQETLEIFVTGDNQLTLKGERKTTAPEKGVWHRQERGAGTFTRSLTLPFEVDRDRIEAKLEHGVLSLKLAKHIAAKPRKITVKAE